MKFDGRGELNFRAAFVEILYKSSIFTIQARERKRTFEDCNWLYIGKRT